MRGTERPDTNRSRYERLIYSLNFSTNEIWIRSSVQDIRVRMFHFLNWLLILKWCTRALESFLCSQKVVAPPNSSFSYSHNEDTSVVCESLVWKRNISTLSVEKHSLLIEGVAYREQRDDIMVALFQPTLYIGKLYLLVSSC